MEAEYIAASSSVDEIIWIRKLLAELQCKQESPTVLYIDNQSAIAASLLGGKESRRKHIDVKYHSIVENIDNGIVTPQWINTKDNQADLFTKALDVKSFTPLVIRVMGHGNNTSVDTNDIARSSKALSIGRGGVLKNKV
jgi:hypothetical protein